jgi:hypothetical protein
LVSPEYRQAHLEAIRASDRAHWHRRKARESVKRSKRKREMRRILNVLISRVFGSACQNCKDTPGLRTGRGRGSGCKMLVLHHRYYAHDSVIPTDGRHRNLENIRRKIEALCHPERFMLLCSACHCKMHIGKAKVMRTIRFDLGAKFTLLAAPAEGPTIMLAQRAMQDSLSTVSIPRRDWC